MHTSPFSGIFRFTNCSFSIKISAFLCSSVNVWRLAGYGYFWASTRDPRYLILLQPQPGVYRNLKRSRATSSSRITHARNIPHSHSSYRINARPFCSLSLTWKFVGDRIRKSRSIKLRKESRALPPVFTIYISAWLEKKPWWRTVAYYSLPSPSSSSRQPGASPTTTTTTPDTTHPQPHSGQASTSPQS